MEREEGGDGSCAYGLLAALDASGCALKAVQCVGEHAPSLLLGSGAVASGLYGIGVPALYAFLLFSCRHAIAQAAEARGITSANGETTAVSQALSPEEMVAEVEQAPAGAEGKVGEQELCKALEFLHASLKPDMLYWPLVEALRAVSLTGFLALVAPGTMLQLLCGHHTEALILLIPELMPERFGFVSPLEQQQCPGSIVQQPTTAQSPGLSLLEQGERQSWLPGIAQNDALLQHRQQRIILRLRRQQAIRF